MLPTPASKTIAKKAASFPQPMREGLSWFSLNWKTREFKLAGKEKEPRRTQLIVQVVHGGATGSSSLFRGFGLGSGAVSSGTDRCKRWQRSMAAS